MSAPDDPFLSAHRRRVLEGMARAVAQHGYAATTIADIVGAAGVSRRTFYEHFGSKADCLVALYEAASHNVLKVLRDALDPAVPWPAQVEQAVAAYLGCLAVDPGLLRTLYVEILSLGPDGLAARRRVKREFAQLLQEAAQRDAPDRVVLTPQMAMAVVGGINELVLECIEQDRIDRLAELAGPAARLLRAASAPPGEGGTPPLQALSGRGPLQSASSAGRDSKRP